MMGIKSGEAVSVGLAKVHKEQGGTPQLLTLIHCTASNRMASGHNQVAPDD